MKMEPDGCGRADCHDSWSVANTLTMLFQPELAGDKVVRFRLSSAGGLPPTGDAPDGEVEDMLLNVVDGSTPKSIITQMNSATTTVEINAGVMTVSDGTNDLFAAPLTSVQDLTVNGRTGDDVVTLSFGRAQTMA